MYAAYKYDSIIELYHVIPYKPVRLGSDRVGFSTNVPGAIKSLAWSYKALGGGANTLGLLMRPQLKPAFLESRYALLYGDESDTRVTIFDGDWHDVNYGVRNHRFTAAVRAVRLGKYLVPVDYP